MFQTVYSRYAMVSLGLISISAKNPRFEIGPIWSIILRFDFPLHYFHKNKPDFWHLPKHMFVVLKKSDIFYCFLGFINGINRGNVRLKININLVYEIIIIISRTYTIIHD